MLILKGMDVSVFTSKIRFVLHYLDLDYDYQEVNLMAGEGRSKEHLALHPAGKVPVLIDGDFVVFESNAIIRYLANREGSSLYPDHIQQQAVIDQWIDFATLHVGQAASRVFYNRVMVDRLGDTLDERSLECGLKFLKRFLPVVDAQLEKNEYLAGGTISLADFVLLAVADLFEISGISLEDYPHLRQWQSRLMKEDFYQKCYSSYRDMIASKAG